MLLYFSINARAIFEYFRNRNAMNCFHLFICIVLFCLLLEKDIGPGLIKDVEAN